MRRLFTLLFSFSLCLQIFPTDTIIAAPLDILEKVSLLQPDSIRFKEFKADTDYDYYSPQIKVENERAWYEWILNKLYEWLARDTGDPSADRSIDATYLIIGIILLVGLLLIIFIYQPSLFFRNKSRKIDYTVEEDNIYGWNFEKLIGTALQDKEYNHAIRWKYMQTLKLLDDRELIKWHPNKTVNEYVYELKSPTLRALFKDISFLFLYFRYGNFRATEAHYNEVASLSNNIKNTLRG